MTRTELIELAELLAAGTITDSEADRLADFLRQIAQAKPVAWGWPIGATAMYDCILPEEHSRHEGKYTVPLYTLPLED